MADYQRAFNVWREQYNQIRPHHALDMATPDQRYRPSAWSMPSTLAEPCYPDYFQLYSVASNGCIKIGREWLFVGEGLKGCRLGLETEPRSKNQPAPLGKKRNLFYLNQTIVTFNPQSTI